MGSRNKSTKQISFAIAISLALIFLTIILLKTNQTTPEQLSSNVIIENDIQIIEIEAKAGGYYPKTIYAKRGMETKLKIFSKNSYGCEGDFKIPALKISQILPSNGTSEFDLGKLTNNILGTCSMGMYTFIIKTI